jgi:putative PIN family toxin of toxin-antitoxin system
LPFLIEGLHHIPNLCISKEIIHEVLGVLAQKFSKGPEELPRTAVFLSELAELVVPRKKLAVLDDEPDNRILECAVTGHADILVTGDRAMLNLKKYQEIRILSLRQFLDEISVPDSLAAPEMRIRDYCVSIFSRSGSPPWSLRIVM